MTTLTFTVAGLPAPQGSKRYLGNGVMVESSKRVASWRADVRAAADLALQNISTVGITELWDTPLHVFLGFGMPRPKAHYRTGRNAHLLRDGAPTHPAGKPDLDKLARAVLDALTGVVWADDSHIVDLVLAKAYCEDGEQPGINVIVLDEVAP